MNDFEKKLINLMLDTCSDIRRQCDEEIIKLQEIEDNINKARDRLREVIKNEEIIKGGTNGIKH